MSVPTLAIETPARRRSPLASPRAAQYIVLLTAVVACAWTFAYLTRSRTDGSSFAWVNHDVAHNLYTGRLLFTGHRLYVDRYETNPPAISLLSGLVDWLARRLSLSAILLFHGVVCLVGAFGLWATQAVYARARQPIGLLLVSLSYLLVLVGCGLPGNGYFTYAFGQREQLFALVFLPYLLARLFAEAPGRAGWALVFLTGLFSSFKPHFLVLVLAVETIRLCERRAPGRRLWPALALGAATPYVALFAHSPRSFAAFVTDLLPLHLAGVYGYYNQPYARYVRSTPHHWLLVYGAAMALFLALATWRRAIRPRTCLGLAGLALVAYLLVVQQHKFWEYHSICVVSLVLVVGIHLASMLTARLTGVASRALFGLLAVVLAAQLTAALLGMRRMITNWRDGRGVGPPQLVLRAWRVLEDRPRTLYYSTSNVYLRLALYLDQRVVGKWGHDFVYPSIIRTPDPERRTRLLRDYCAEQRELIATAKPDAIVFHSTGQALATREQEMLSVLVGQCRIVPAAEYGAQLAVAPGVAVFLRRQPVATTGKRPAS